MLLNINIKLLFFSILTLSTIITSGCSNPSKTYIIRIKEYPSNSLNFVEEYELKRHVEKSIDSIAAYFGFTYKDTLLVYIYTNGSAEGYSNKIILSETDIRNVRLILHEVSHAVLKLQPSNFEMEGLATFMELMFDPHEKYINNRYTKLLESNRSGLFPIRFLMQSDSIFIKRNKPNISIAYAQAGLFYKYLAYTFGQEKMRQLYFQGLCNIEGIFGQSIDTLDIEWQKWLFNVAPPDTTFFD